MADPNSINIAALLSTVKESVVDQLHGRLAQRGFEGIRPSHGCVFRFIDPENGTRLTTLAERAGMTKQALGEHVSDLASLGYVERVPDPSDGRAKIVRLTDRGQSSHAAAKEIFNEIEHEWAARLGEERMAAMRETLEELSGTQALTAPRM